MVPSRTTCSPYSLACQGSHYGNPSIGQVFWPKYGPDLCTALPVPLPDLFPHMLYRKPHPDSLGGRLKGEQRGVGYFFSVSFSFGAPLSDSSSAR